MAVIGRSEMDWYPHLYWVRIICEPAMIQNVASLWIVLKYIVISLKIEDFVSYVKPTVQSLHFVS